jgi:hypothetical protein
MIVKDFVMFIYNFSLGVPYTVHIKRKLRQTAIKLAARKFKHLFGFVMFYDDVIYVIYNTILYNLSSKNVSKKISSQQGPLFKTFLNWRNIACNLMVLYVLLTIA